MFCFVPNPLRFVPVLSTRSLAGVPTGLAKDQDLPLALDHAQGLATLSQGSKISKRLLGSNTKLPDCIPA